MILVEQWVVEFCELCGWADQYKYCQRSEVIEEQDNEEELFDLPIVSGTSKKNSEMSCSLLEWYMLE